MEFIKLKKVTLLALLISCLALFVGCTDYGNDDDDDVTVEGCIAGCEDASPPKPEVVVDPTEVTVTLSGVAAEGAPLSGATMKIQLSEGGDGVQTATVTTGSDGSYTVKYKAASQAAAYPAIVSAAKDGEIVKSLAFNGTDNVNVNPLTNATANEMIATGLSSVDKDAFNAKGKEIVEAIFGVGVDFALFSTQSFVARTDGNKANTTLGDLLLDLLAQQEGGLDSLRSEGAKLLEGIAGQAALSAIAAATYDSASAAASVFDNLTLTNATSAVQNLKDFNSAFVTASADYTGNVFYALIALASVVAEQYDPNSNDDIASQVSGFHGKVKDQINTLITNSFDTSDPDKALAQVFGLAEGANAQLTADPTANVTGLSLDDPEVEFWVHENQVTITAGDNEQTASVGTTGESSSTPTFNHSVVEANGAPSITFRVRTNETVAANYEAQLGLLVKDQNSDRAIWAILENVALTVNSDGTMGATVPVDAELNVRGTVQNGDNAAGIEKSNIVNREADGVGIVTDAEGNITYDPNILQAKITERFASLNYDLLESIQPVGTYNYTIYVTITKKPRSKIVQLGTYESSTFTEFSRKNSGEIRVGDKVISAGSAYVLSGSYTIN